MSLRPPIGRADLLDVVRGLGVELDDEETLGAVARTLGLAGSSAAPARAAGAIEEPAAAAPDVEPEPEPPPPRPTIERTPAADLPTDPAAPPTAVRSRFTVERAAPREPPGWLLQVRALEPAGRAVEPAVPEPLLDRRRSRSVLSMALATRAGEGELDLDQVVRTIARGDAVRRLPRRSYPTLARGVQLLLDRSPAMLPFLADLRALEEEVRGLAGAEAVEVLSFSGCPTRCAGDGPIDEWGPYDENRRPPRGTRVLCASDLGIGLPLTGHTPASPHEWLDLADLLRAAGCPLLVLCPYRRERWPEPLQRRLAVLHWDRTATAALAARLLG